MKESGINIKIFGSHSTRSASTSKCKIYGLSFKEIAKSAGWSDEKTFAQIQRACSRGFFKLFIQMKFAVFYIYMLYGIIYTGKIYGVNYVQNNINQIEKNSGLSFLHSFFQIPIYTRGLETTQQRIYKLNQHLRVRVDLNSSLFPVLGYRFPPPTLRNFK